jgi:hypothetical protein
MDKDKCRNGDWKQKNFSIHITCFAGFFFDGHGIEAKQPIFLLASISMDTE